MENKINAKIQKLKKIEILHEIQGGGRTLSWFEGKTPKDDIRAEANKELLLTGFIEKIGGYPYQQPHPFRLTQQGKEIVPDRKE